MNELEAMRIFVRVTEQASFTRAADGLGLPKASVSTAVRRLEAMLGTQLLHRTTRSVRPTADGQQFYDRCRDLLADFDELQSMYRSSPQTLRGRLRVDMPGGLALATVITRLPEFLDRHPNIQVELSCTDRRVDVVREGFDCVLRIGALPDSSLVARPLGQLRSANCASPGYLQRYGVPRTLDDLAAHRIVHYVGTLGSKPPGWEYFDGTRCHFIDMPSVLTVNSVDAYQAACLAGLGMIQVPAAGERSLLDSGRLVEVLPDYPAEPMPVSLVYPQRRHLPQRVRAFMDWVAEILAPSLDRA